MKLKKGDIAEISIQLEFEGTIRNHAILVEDQFIPTINNKRTKFKVKLDGDPLNIVGRFIGAPNSEIKKFEVTVNDHIAYKVEDVKLKYQAVRIEVPVPYSQIYKSKKPIV